MLYVFGWGVGTTLCKRDGSPTPGGHFPCSRCRLAHVCDAVCMPCGPPFHPYKNLCLCAFPCAYQWRTRSLCGVCLCPHPSPSGSCVAPPPPLFLVLPARHAPCIPCVSASHPHSPPHTSVAPADTSCPTTLLGQNPARPKPCLQTRFILFLVCAPRWIGRVHVVSRPDCKPCSVPYVPALCVSRAGHIWWQCWIGTALSAVVALMMVVARVTHALGRASNVDLSRHPDPLLVQQHNTDTKRMIIIQKQTLATNPWPLTPTAGAGPHASPQEGWATQRMQHSQTQATIGTCWVWSVVAAREVCGLGKGI